jgi:hypothetical protein
MEPCLLQRLIRLSFPLVRSRLNRLRREIGIIEFLGDFRRRDRDDPGNVKITLALDAL